MALSSGDVRCDSSSVSADFQDLSKVCVLHQLLLMPDDRKRETQRKKKGQVKPRLELRFPEDTVALRAFRIRCDNHLHYSTSDGGVVKIASIQSFSLWTCSDSEAWRAQVAKVDAHLILTSFGEWYRRSD